MKIIEVTNKIPYIAYVLPDNENEVEKRFKNKPDYLSYSIKTINLIFPFYVVEEYGVKFKYYNCKKKALREAERIKGNLYTINDYYDPEKNHKASPWSDQMGRLDHEHFGDE